MGIHITSNFDAGNIRVLDANDPTNVQLAINFDAGDEHMQWFHFRVHGARDEDLRLRLTNAGKASYVDGWTDYQACASYDRDHWFRVPTRYTDGELPTTAPPPFTVIPARQDNSSASSRRLEPTS